MKKDNKKKLEADKLDKKEKEIKIVEIISSAVLALISILGIIFCSIAIARHNRILSIDLDHALTGLIVGIASLILIGYLYFETFYTEKVYDIELTVRSTLLLIVIFGSIISIGFGISTFVA